jgi:hypothetical protein
MNATDTGAGGYEKSEMRTYLTGNFLTGLKAAGVPDGVLWGPARALSKGINGMGSVTLSDKLWLPTEREMFQDGKESAYGYGPYSANGETADNQARLAYYTDNGTRLKAWGGSTSDYYPDMKSGYGNRYWTGSMHSRHAFAFCGVDGSGSDDIVEASGAGGVAPAFCVN